MNCPPLISSKLKTPNVLWYQNGISVILRIMLTDVEKYYLRVEYGTLRFSTIIGDNSYYLWINLFGTVIPEKTLHENKGREIVVKLAKAHKWLDWLRLHIEKVNEPMIRPDLERIQIEEKQIYDKAEVKPGKLEEVKKKYLRIMPDVPSDDDASDDDAWNSFYM